MCGFGNDKLGSAYFSFKSYIDTDNWDYLPQEEIEVVVKRIIFDKEAEFNDKISFKVN